MDRSLKDIHGMSKILEDSKVIDQVVNDISGSNDLENKSLNLYEWIFVRSVAVAWQIAAGNKEYITKDELLDIGMKVMPQ